MWGEGEAYGRVGVRVLLISAILLVVGFMVWDYIKHRQVQEYVFKSPDIPGAEVPKGPGAELTAFHAVKNTLTRRFAEGGSRVTVVWNSPRFFKALAAAEGKQDIKRHEVLYHEYAKRFRVHRDLVFTVSVDSTEVDLQTYQLRENSTLRNDKGDEVKPWRWEEARGSSSRHMEGVLYFPQRTEAGERMMGHLVGEHIPGESPPVYLELVLKEWPKKQEGVFRWDLSSE